MSDNRVAITAVGLITPLGRGVERNWERFSSGESAIGYYPRSELPHCFQYQGRAGECDPPEDVTRQLTSQIRFLNRSSLLGLAASREAFLSSGMTEENVKPERRALYVGAGDFTSVGYEFMYPATKLASDAEWTRVDQAKLNRGAIDLVNPFFLLESLNNNLFSFLSAYLNFTGPSTSLSSQSPCGSNALELAYRSIKQGRADAALAVGCGSWVGDIPIYEMQGLGLLSGCHQGARSYRPLSRDRDGFIPGEGGAALVLEAAKSAEARGAPVLGWVTGVGNTMSTEPEHGLGISPDAYRAAFQSALDESGSGMTDLDFVIAHGSGTRKGDAAELEALVSLTESISTSIPVSAMKAQTGHMGAASDIAEIVFGLRSAAESVAPGTGHFKSAEEAYASLSISAQPQPLVNPGGRFLSTSMGVGGQISIIAVESV